jgi:hypothetical protein
VRSSLNIQVIKWLKTAKCWSTLQKMTDTPLQTSRHKCEEIIKIGITEIGWEHVDWFDVA